VVRKFVAPALELMMLEKARNKEFDREKALLIFGEMYAAAVAGDGYVGPRDIRLAVGGELGRGATLLRLATLLLLNQLLSDELKFGMRVYVERGVYYIAAYGENAAKLMRLLAVSAPSASGGYLSPKFKEFMKEARVEVRVGNIRETDSGTVAADLTISVGGVAMKYNVYLLKDAIKLEFNSTDRSRVELAARLLKPLGVNAEVKKFGGRDEWRIEVTTDKLAAGREELRKALAEIVRETIKRNLVNTNTAERWLEKLERGIVLMEGWPKYEVRLTSNGALEVKFGSTNPDSIERETQRLEKMGLKRGVHFTVKMPEEGRGGYVLVLKAGLMRAARLSVRGKNEQRELAAKFVELILQRAKEACRGAEQCAVYEKAQKIIEVGMLRGSQKLERFEKWVEVNGKTYVVKVKGWSAKTEESQHGKTLLRITIKAEMGLVKDGQIVDRVEHEYKITFTRYGDDNAIFGYAYARVNAPGGREADAERYSALIKALTGREPWIQRMRGGKIQIACSRVHLEGYMLYDELVDVVEGWLEEVGR
jgi:hypothetical protein